MKKPLVVPKFKSEDEERNFWAQIDVTDYAEVSDFKRVTFPNLKPTTQPVTMRLPKYLIARVKEQANQLAIPYQILMKQYIARGAFPKGKPNNT
jgi:predicted DNA binding CopG/RHH family protein